NVCMEPFRAFVADKVNERQRTLGFVMQSFFIGVGAVLAFMLPKALHYLGVGGTTASGIPLTVVYSFRAGTAVFLAAVLWTVCTSTEHPPEQEEHQVKQAKASLGARARAAIAGVVSAVRDLPPTMKQLAPVQICTWLSLFCMWMFFPLVTAKFGMEWAG